MQRCNAGSSGHTAEHLPGCLEQRCSSRPLTKSCCSWSMAVPKIEVEPHPRGRFGPAPHHQHHGERVHYPNHLQVFRGG